MSDLEDFGRQEDMRRMSARIVELLNESERLRADLAAAQRTTDAANALYLVIREKLEPFFPVGDRGLDWDVLPSTLGKLARDRNAAQVEVERLKDGLLRAGADAEGHAGSPGELIDEPQEEHDYLREQVEKLKDDAERREEAAYYTGHNDGCSYAYALEDTGPLISIEDSFKEYKKSKHE